jgi:hypothetical protein
MDKKGERILFCQVVFYLSWQSQNSVRKDANKGKMYFSPSLHHYRLFNTGTGTGILLLLIIFLLLSLFTLLFTLLLSSISGLL